MWRLYRRPTSISNLGSPTRWPPQSTSGSTCQINDIRSFCQQTHSSSCPYVLLWSSHTIDFRSRLSTDHPPCFIKWRWIPISLLPGPCFRAQLPSKTSPHAKQIRTYCDWLFAVPPKYAIIFLSGRPGPSLCPSPTTSACTCELWTFESPPYRYIFLRIFGLPTWLRVSSFCCHHHFTFWLS